MANLNKDANSVAVAGGVSDIDGVTILPFEINHTNGRLLVSAILAGGLNSFELTATGTINGLNAAFTFVSQPSYVVSDGAWYKVNNGWTWNAGTLTATMTVPPTYSIWGFS